MTPATATPSSNQGSGFPTLSPEELAKFTDVDMQRELDRVKTRVFMDSNAAFLAAVMSGMYFEWSDSIPTAATNGETFWWNPAFFLALEPEVRKTVLVHELWHAALLHMVRMENRNPLIWNIACDYRINNGLEDDGYSFKDVEDCCKDQQYAGMSEEQIYETLIKNPPPKPKPMWGTGPCTPNGAGGAGNPTTGGPDTDGPEQIGDMIPASKKSQAAAVNNVIRAVHQTKMAGQAGTIPGSIEGIIDKFVNPIVPWEVKLQRWTQDLLEEDYTWSRPNRRYQDIYLPSRIEEDGRLEHLMFFQDTSGSMTDQELVRTNSEIKYIWDVMKPKKLTTVQFDTRIIKTDVFEEGDSYDEMKINGRGGTDLAPVREMIIKENPTAVVIFSDLYVPPMQPLPKPVPVLWVTSSQGGYDKPKFGEVIEIREPQ